MPLTLAPITVNRTSLFRAFTSTTASPRRYAMTSAESVVATACKLSATKARSRRARSMTRR